MVRSSGPRTASTMQNSLAPSAAVSRAAASTWSVSRKGVASTGVSKRDDWAQKWQSSGQPPVLADRMPSTSTVSPHQARRTSWARAASDGTMASGTRGQLGQLLRGEAAPAVGPADRGRRPVCSASGEGTARHGRSAAGMPPCRAGLHAVMSQGHRIVITPADMHVEVNVGGEKIAESKRPVLLEETGLPIRYYLPREDVRTDLLAPTNRETTCPFKGQASYWSADIDGKVYDDVVWSYETPIPEAEGVTGLMCFYNERVDLVVDGEPQARPETPFSR